MTLKYLPSPRAKSPLLIIPLLQSNKLGAQLEDIAAKAGLAADWLQKDFKATAGSICPLYSSQTKAKWILLGLGETTSLSFIEQAFRKLSFHHQDLLEPQIGLWHQYAAEGEGFDPEVYAMGSISGLLLGCYQIGAFKTNEKTTHPLKKRGARVSLIGPEAKSMSAAARRGKATAETQVRILDLVNGPANKIKPESLAKWAVQSGKAHDFKVKVFNKAQIQKTGLHALMAVNQGSDYPPQFIIMEYKPKGRSAKNLPKVGLVGKGVTFDTGGLSIKGSVNMHYMKSDMGGAAAVLGAMELTAKLKLPVHLIGIVPTTDNCVDAKAVKPGDVINSYDGQTIEVIDTDAEGRLILADGLAYMNKHYKPDIMIDLATLTGNCVRALGYHAGGLFTNNDDLSEKLTTAGQACGERLWRLPIWDDYRCEIESEVADVRNLSLRPVAGAITAAKFLEVFTAKHPCWAHLDIAGVAFGSHSFSKQKSATAFGVKLLVEMLRRL